LWKKYKHQCKHGVIDRAHSVQVYH